MDDRSSLLCENKKPSVVGIDNWPTLQCCNDKDLCNVGVTHRQIAVNGQHGIQLSLHILNSSVLLCCVLWSVETCLWSVMSCLFVLSSW